MVEPNALRAGTIDKAIVARFVREGVVSESVGKDLSWRARRVWWIDHGKQFRSFECASCMLTYVLQAYRLKLGFAMQTSTDLRRSVSIRSIRIWFQLWDSVA
jgi:hypothetical protein